MKRDKEGDREVLPGLVNFDPAVDYHFCLALPAAFSQPGDHLLAEPCIVFQPFFWLQFCIVVHAAAGEPEGGVVVPKLATCVTVIPAFWHIGAMPGSRITVGQNKLFGGRMD